MPTKCGSVPAPGEPKLPCRPPCAARPGSPPGPWPAPSARWSARSRRHQPRDGAEVLGRVVLQLVLEDMREQGHRTLRRHQQRVASGGAPSAQIDGDAPAGAGLVFHHHDTPGGRADGITRHARQRIDAAPWGKTHDDAHAGRLGQGRWRGSQHKGQSEHTGQRLQRGRRRERSKRMRVVSRFESRGVRIGAAPRHLRYPTSWALRLPRFRQSR